MIGKLFGRPQASVMAGKTKETPVARPPLEAVLPTVLQPAPVSLQVHAESLTAEAILERDFERQPFPPGFNSENGAFLLIRIDKEVIVLRREDIVTSALGYAWVRRITNALPHVKLLDVSASTMREFERRTEQVAVGGFRSQAVTARQQEGFELVEAGLKVDASDIHIDISAQGPRAPEVLVRFRVNGELEPHKRLKDVHSVQVYQELVRAFFQNEETSVAHERNTALVSTSAGRHWGRLQLPVREAQVRFESNTTSTGSTTNLRILTYKDKPTMSTDLSGLGFSGSQAALILKGFTAPHGLCIAAGPTGAGKTLTIATALAMNKNAAKQHRVGMEQPPEISIEYMQQLAFGDDDFAEAAKGVLRLDPDVIYPGEILSPAVARMAVQAAMTGHLVPASLHGNNVATALRRLVGEGGMGISLEDLCGEDMLQLIEFQTLVPVLCSSCRQSAKPYLAKDELSALEDLGLSAGNMYVRYQSSVNDCPACQGRGAKGRTVLAEVVRPDADFLEALMEGGVSEAMRSYRSLRTSAFHEEDQAGKNAFEHGLYKAHKGQICIRHLLDNVGDVAKHPQVRERRRARVSQPKAEAKPVRLVASRDEDGGDNA